MSDVQTRLDGTTLVVRIPMRFQRRGGRKRIVAPDGTAIVPTSKPHPDGTLVKALARAWRWQRMLDDGVYTSVSEIGNRASGSNAHVGAARAAAAGELGGAALQPDLTGYFGKEYDNWPDHHLRKILGRDAYVLATLTSISPHWIEAQWASKIIRLMRTPFLKAEA